MKLYGYQTRAMAQLYDWFRAGNGGNPCMVMPTGSGKSHIIAQICHDALNEWPGTRVLMMTHVKELIEQNAAKLKALWPCAPLGIYSAGMKQREIGKPITFGGIQSMHTRASDFGHVDLCLIDEAHLISHKKQGMYRTMIDALSQKNPDMRVIGLTATPYRLGHGYITDKPAIFDALIEPVSIAELVYGKYLTPLRSKHTQTQFDLLGVHVRGGDYVESELQHAVNIHTTNESVVREVISRAGDRKAWLFFCTGVDHAQAIKAMLLRYGITTECVLGSTPKSERERIIAEFKAGKIRALTNANVLTTGFDYPDIDLLVFLRPTLSPGLYIQMAGRGMRKKSHTDHCMVLDFANLVATHGPITAVNPPKKKKGGGSAPTRTCPECQEILPASASVCDCCGYVFEKPEKSAIAVSLSDDDIMGQDRKAGSINVSRWLWRPHTSRTSGNEVLHARIYEQGVDGFSIEVYFAILNSGVGGEKARWELNKIYRKAMDQDFRFMDFESMGEISRHLNKIPPPKKVTYKRDGRFFRVTNYQY